MKDKNLPKSVGEVVPLAPSVLSPKQKRLCEKLDALHVQFGLKSKPSDMFRGAVFAARIEFRGNPDWIAQAANSLREILYPFYSGKVKAVTTNKEDILKKYGSVRANEELIQKMGRLWGLLNGLTHHGNIKTSNVDFSTFAPKDFEQLLGDFEGVILDALARQVDIHQEIDEILTGKPENLGVIQSLGQ